MLVDKFLHAFDAVQNVNLEPPLLDAGKQDRLTGFELAGGLLELYKVEATTRHEHQPVGRTHRSDEVQFKTQTSKAFDRL